MSDLKRYDAQGTECSDGYLVFEWAERLELDKTTIRTRMTKGEGIVKTDEDRRKNKNYHKKLLKEKESVKLWNMAFFHAAG